MLHATYPICPLRAITTEPENCRNEGRARVRKFPRIKGLTRAYERAYPGHMTTTRTLPTTTPDLLDLWLAEQDADLLAEHLHTEEPGEDERLWA